MRVCLLSYRAYKYSGGQGIYVRYLSKHLQKLGHDVDVVAGPPYPDLVEGIQLIKLPSLDLYRFPESKRFFIDPRLLNTWPNFVEWFGECRGHFTEPAAFGMRAYEMFHHNGYRKKYDIVHDNQCITDGILKLKGLGIPMVTTIHHPITLDRKIAVDAASSAMQRLGIKRWYSFVETQKRVARKLSHFITDSENSLREIVQGFGLESKQFRVIYCGVDQDIFKENPEIHRSNNRLLVINSGDTPLKGLRYLLEAIAEIRKHRDIELTIIGTPLRGGYTEGAIEELGLIDCVHYTGKIDTLELVHHYSSVALVVVPSIYEGFGLPAAEAMSCGTPVISTTAGALPEVVGDAGVLIPPGNTRAIVEAVSSLLDNESKRKSMGIQGRERVKKLFNWDSAAKATADYYSEAIEAQSSLRVA